MKLLLDTHVILWMDSDPNRLSSTAQSLITDNNNDIFISVVSLWEIAIISALGKLTLRLSLRQLVDENHRVNGLRVLNISPDHVYELEQLPAVHNDPFDRMIASVARCENATLLSADAVFQQYPVTLQW